MAEYIDRDRAVAFVEAMPSKADALNVLRKLKAADVVPVVRCRDCQNWRNNITCGAVILSGKLWNYCHKHNEMMAEDDFCSRGERKDGDGK